MIVVFVLRHGSFNLYLLRSRYADIETFLARHPEQRLRSVALPVIKKSELLHVRKSRDRALHVGA